MKPHHLILFLFIIILTNAIKNYKKKNLAKQSENFNKNYCDCYQNVLDCDINCWNINNNDHLLYYNCVYGEQSNSCIRNMIDCVNQEFEDRSCECEAKNKSCIYSCNKFYSWNEKEECLNECRQNAGDYHCNIE